MNALYYGSAELVKTTYTMDVWLHMENGGTRLYTMFADMTLAEVIQTLAVDFGLVELVEGEVM